MSHCGILRTLKASGFVVLQILDVQITYAACLKRWLILSSLHEADGVECSPTVPGREVRPNGDASFWCLCRVLTTVVPSKAKQEIALRSKYDTVPWLDEASVIWIFHYTETNILPSTVTFWSCLFKTEVWGCC